MKDRVVKFSHTGAHLLLLLLFDWSVETKKSYAPPPLLKNIVEVANYSRVHEHLLLVPLCFKNVV